MVKADTNNYPNQVRIIAGKWRGRKLEVLNLPNLRPTPIRIRETAFNWLAPYIQGSIVLDMFAGTGALGFEALSRGAAFAYFIEQQPSAIKILQQNIEKLAAQENTTVVHADALTSLLNLNPKFDIIFLDPPFNSDLLTKSLDTILKINQEFLPKIIYLETDTPANIASRKEFDIIKSKRAGNVFYYLITLR